MVLYSFVIHMDSQPHRNIKRSLQQFLVVQHEASWVDSE